MGVIYKKLMAQSLIWQWVEGFNLILLILLRVV